MEYIPIIYVFFWNIILIYYEIGDKQFLYCLIHYAFLFYFNYYINH